MAAFSAALVGNFRKQVEAIDRAHKRAATTTVRRSTTILKNAIRREVKRGGLGDGVANAVRDQVYPAKGLAANPAGSVYSKAIYKRPGGLVDLITVFREGAIIVATGLFLLIGKRKREGVKAELTGKRLAREKRVKLLPRLKGIDAAYERAAATLQPNYEREYTRQLAREASK